jgi:hypothetical protein
MRFLHCKYNGVADNHKSASSNKSTLADGFHSLVYPLMDTIGSCLLADGCHQLIMALVYFSKWM